MEGRWRQVSNSVGLLVLRLGVGGYMLTHGLGKVRMLRAGQFEMMGDPIGLGSVASLVLVTLAEFLCALLVMLGAGTRFAAAAIVFAMGVAAFVAHGGDPWTMEGGYALFFSGEAQMPLSKEPALLYLFAFLALALTGAGRYSFDELVWPRLRRAMRRGSPRTRIEG